MFRSSGESAIRYSRSSMKRRASTPLTSAAWKSSRRAPLERHNLATLRRIPGETRSGARIASRMRRGSLLMISILRSHHLKHALDHRVLAITQAGDRTQPRDRDVTIDEQMIGNMNAEHPSDHHAIDL